MSVDVWTGPVGPGSMMGNSTRYNPKVRYFPNLNENFSVAKTIPIREQMHLDIRAEAFNVTNTPHFGIPSGLSVSSLQLNTDGSIKNLNGFGVITSTNNSSRDYDERYFRVGLHLSF